MASVLFLHGWHSVVGGVKPTYLKNAGHEVINPKLDDDDFDLAVRTAQAEYDEHQPDVIIGSSRGGAVAVNIDSKDTPLVLLCPAWKNWGTATAIKLNSVILHSRQDDLIPFADSEELVINSGLPSETLIEAGNDHRLADPEPLNKMVEACESLIGKTSQMEAKSVRGVTMAPKGILESCLLKATMGLKYGQCYWNCLRLLESEKYHDAIYVEGIVVKPKKSFHAHGWLEVDGEIIDPTQPTAGFFYFPALHFKGFTVLRRAIVDIPRDRVYQEDLPVYKRFGRNGERSGPFALALEYAVREFGVSTPFNPSEEL